MNNKEIQQLIDEFHIKNLTTDEIKIIIGNSKDPEFIKLIDNYKKNNPEKFQAEINRLSKPMSQEERSYRFPNSNLPKCPTCGSNNIKKISFTKRWFSTSFLGLASSNIGKTMECNNCGYKW